MKGNRSSKAVATWLFIGVGMLIIQIIIGGITRLTGSGLSITEWDVITGTLPPLNAEAWATEFSKYQQSPQYRLLNSDFTMSDFKFIFFWEWFHRFWARLIGVVFAIPFIYFLVRRQFKPDMVKPLIILFLLGALQGAVGWIMVASGLTGDAIYVAPTRLALHFIFAMVLLGYTFWFALKLSVRNSAILYAPRLRNFAWGIIALLALQFIFGALMAGHRAAPAAPTWPSINGGYIPQNFMAGGLRDLIENRIAIHFVHRNLAYLLVVLVLVWSIQAFRTTGGPVFSKWKATPLLFVLLQTGLGIATVLSSVNIRVAKWNTFEWMAQLHQFVALLLLLSLVGAAFLLQRRSLVRRS